MHKAGLVMEPLRLRALRRAADGTKPGHWHPWMNRDTYFRSYSWSFGDLFFSYGPNPDFGVLDVPKWQGYNDTFPDGFSLHRSAPHDYRCGLRVANCHPLELIAISA